MSSDAEEDLIMVYINGSAVATQQEKVNLLRTCMEEFTFMSNFHPKYKETVRKAIKPFLSKIPTKNDVVARLISLYHVFIDNDRMGVKSSAFQNLQSFFDSVVVRRQDELDKRATRAFASNKRAKTVNKIRGKAYTAKNFDISLMPPDSLAVCIYCKHKSMNYEVSTEGSFDFVINYLFF
jgi:hypothetical protein